MKPEKMIRTILWWMFLGTIFLFIIIWLFSGGPRQVWEKASEIAGTYAHVKDEATQESVGGVLGILTSPNPNFLFTLPWQPAQLPQGPITTDPEVFFAQDSGSEAPARAEPELPTNPQVRIAYISPDESPTREYIELTASSDISLKGMTLTTASGRRISLPQATPHTPYENELNIQQDVTMSPGENAIIITGASPVGTSYKEGSTWYLFLGSPTALWDFTHETVELKDGHNALVDRYSY